MIIIYKSNDISTGISFVHVPTNKIYLNKTFLISDYLDQTPVLATIVAFEYRFHLFTYIMDELRLNWSVIRFQVFSSLFYFFYYSGI